MTETFTKESMACLICGEEFIPLHKQQFTCSSDECTKERRRRFYQAKRDEKIEAKRVPITCKQCGKVFTPEGNYSLDKIKYCSKECRDIANEYVRKEKYFRNAVAKLEPRNCIVCDNEFTPDTSHSYAVCCSPECNRVVQARKRKEAYLLKKIEVLLEPRICPNCDKEYIPTDQRQVYCSVECREIASKARKKEYQHRLPSEVRAERTRKVRLNGNWHKAMERDKRQCQVCGTKENVLVHHLNGKGEKKKNIRVKDDSRLENLLVVCEQCHKDIHGIFLIRKDDGWVVQGNIFSKLNINGFIEVKQ